VAAVVTSCEVITRCCSDVLIVLSVVRVVWFILVEILEVDNVRVIVAVVDSVSVDSMDPLLMQLFLHE
jgi:hypothetical protein